MIQVESLTRNYDDIAAVKDVSFDIGSGEIVGLLGHNGAGKTTIMKIMTGYLEPTAGEIHIDGLDIKHKLREVQSRIGYLPENDPLYPEMTVIDYLDYAATLHGMSNKNKLARIRAVIQQTGLQPKADAVIGTLSRGYRQRVGVAQAIIHQPTVLILDEPTNGLDPTQVQQMRELIRGISERATVILSTHILQEVQAVCDRVIILRNGEKALDAQMSELSDGRRLMLSMSGDLLKAEVLLRGIAGVRQISKTGTEHEAAQYLIELSAGVDRMSQSAEIARQLTGAGFALHELRPERKNLETIFGEISVH